MYVKLNHYPNPDIAGGYWEPTAKTKPKLVLCLSFGAASRACMHFISKHQLGAGNWSGGQIYEDAEKKVLIGQVSYNGKVWAPIPKGQPWVPGTQPLWEPTWLECTTAPACHACANKLHFIVDMARVLGDLDLLTAEDCARLDKLGIRMNKPAVIARKKSNAKK